MKTLILLLSFGLPMLAQNNPTARALEAASQPCRGTTGVRLLVAVNGITQCATLDASIIVDTSTNPPSVRAAAGGGTGTVNFMDGESLPRAGTFEPINGVNATFTMSFVPNPPASLEVYVNGLFQWPGWDYTLSGNSITFVPLAVPSTGSRLVVKGRR